MTPSPRMRSSSSTTAGSVRVRSSPAAWTPRAGCGPAAGTCPRAGRRSSSRRAGRSATGRAPRRTRTRAPAGNGERPAAVAAQHRVVAVAAAGRCRRSTAGRDDDRPGEQGVGRVGHDEQRVDVGPHDRSTRRERVGSGTGRRRAQHAVAAEPQQRPPVEGDGDLEHPLAVGALEDTSFSAQAVEIARRRRDLGVDRDTLLDRVVAAHDRLDRRRRARRARPRRGSRRGRG